MYLYTHKTMTTSCPGYLDRFGIWNNGFDCSSPRICCGTETNRYCCVPASTSPTISSSSSPPLLFSTLYQTYDEFDSYAVRSSNSILSEKWLFMQMCTIAVFLAILLLVFIIIYLCLTANRSSKYRKTSSVIQLSKPSNRISTISTVSNIDTKSHCTDTSILINTPLNRYPIGNSRNSTTSSSYYMYPNEFEYLCK